jgi:hypothetical protein
MFSRRCVISWAKEANRIWFLSPVSLQSAVLSSEASYRQLGSLTNNKGRSTNNQARCRLSGSTGKLSPYRLPRLTRSGSELSAKTTAVAAAAGLDSHAAAAAATTTTTTTTLAAAAYAEAAVAADTAAESRWRSAVREHCCPSAPPPAPPAPGAAMRARSARC